MKDDSQRKDRPVSGGSAEWCCRARCLWGGARTSLEVGERIGQFHGSGQQRAEAKAMGPGMKVV